MDMNNLSAAERNLIFSVENKGGVPVHGGGTVGTDAVAVDLSEYVEQLMILNSHATQSLYVSFDSGANWFTIFAKSALSLDKFTARSFQLKGSGSGTTYEMIYIK